MRNYIAALDAFTGAATAWNPSATSSIQALAVSGSIIYAGGGNGLAALDAASGAPTPWNPNGEALALALSGSTLYVGGGFIYMGDQPRNSIAAFDLLGDMNCDGRIDGPDIQPFLSAKLDPAMYAAAYPCCLASNADIDFSGASDLVDVPLFVDRLLSAL